MTLTEICLLTITVMMIAAAGALVAIVLHLRVNLRLLEGLIRDTRESARRLDDVGAELQTFMQRANHDYRVVSDMAGRVLGEAVLPARNVVALIRGVRAGIGFFFRPGRRLSQISQEKRSGT